MRILIAGAGVGGMTLAALLEQRGLRPTLVERATSFEHAGYMLGIYSLGSRVLHGLGLHERFAAASVGAAAYELRNGRGVLVKSWDMAPITDRFGPLLSSTRPDLVSVLHAGLRHTAIRFGTAVEALTQAGDEVRATLSVGSTETFDLVVGADGMHSRVRGAVFGEQPAFHTGWGGWVWWADGACCPEGTFSEYWGAGRFLGAYPNRRGVGVVAAAPMSDGFEQSGAGRRARVLQRFAGMGAQADALLAALPDDTAPMYFWQLSDVRAREWVRGRVVLLGDAAAGFLPTAGIGASMAMESAAVLADELSRTGVAFLPHALMLYVKRRKQRVERIQADSRHLARMMFVRSAAMCRMRDYAMRWYSLEMLAKNIAKAFDAPI